MYNSASGIETQANISSIKIISDTTSIDIVTDKTQFFVSASIFTSIFQNLLRMTLVLSDPNDIIKNMKLKGNEDVTITFKKDEKDKFITLNFKINSIVNNNVKNTFDKKNLLVFDCISHEYLPGRYVLSKKLVGTGSSIVTDLIKNNLVSKKTLIKDETNFKYEIQTNFKNSLDIINYISKNDNCFFYEDLDGFHYRRYGSLGNNSNIETINFFVNQRQMLGDDVPRAYKLENFHNEILLDKGVINTEFSNIQGTNYVLNSVTKKFSEGTDQLKIGTVPFYNQLETKKSNVDIVYGRIENRLRRFMEVFNLQSHTIEIRINGNLERRVGNKVKLNLAGHDNSELEHELYKGDWVITSIKNELVIGSFTQEIELAKIKFTK